MPNINVLITSISKKVPLIHAVRDALLRINGEGKIYGADIDDTCVGQYFVDDFWMMPRMSELGIDELISYCTDRKISCVIPTRDGELSFFALNKKNLSNNSISVMVSDHEAVTRCLDKLAFYERAKSAGFPVISTVTDIELLNCKRYVVKERYGAGSNGIGLNLSKEEALFRAIGMNTPIFQPYISGSELSIDVYVEKNGRAKGVIARSRDMVVNGESQITTTVNRPDAEELCSMFAEHFNIYGHAVFQILIDESEQCNVIECNSRFGGASTLSICTGLDSFYWFLLESMGEDLSKYPFVRSVNEKRQIRYPTDLIL
jgi:carbamoyl-phosphate synthase large subunit